MLQMLVNMRKTWRMMSLEQKVQLPRLDATAMIRTAMEMKMAMGVGSVPSWHLVASLHQRWMKQYQVSSAGLDVTYAIVFAR
jgi:hypothetical protein